MVKDVFVKILQALMLPGVTVAFLILFARNRSKKKAELPKKEAQS